MVIIGLYLYDNHTKRGLIKHMKKPRNTTGKGYFEVKGSEPLAKLALSVRVPESMDVQVRQIAGEDLSSWLRSAIAEKLTRELLQTNQDSDRGAP